MSVSLDSAELGGSQYDIVERYVAQEVATAKKEQCSISEMVKAMQLSYTNDYLTIEKFAEHHGISETLAQAIINEI